MSYYKIILQDEIIDVGMNFMYWDTQVNRYIYCDATHGEFIYGEVKGGFYHTYWLNTPSIQYTEATVLEVTASEYDELYEQLKEGENITNIPYAPPSLPEVVPEPVPVETPMTIQQMRDKIIKQGQMIDMLTECLLEVSEVIYEE